MTFPPVERAAEVLNTKVTATLALAATRSPGAMLNVTSVVFVGVGASSTVTVAEDGVAENAIPAVEIVTEICFAPAVVPDPIITINVVDDPPTSEHVALEPPTVALHEAAASCAVVIKLVPVTVMVLPT